MEEGHEEEQGRGLRSGGGDGQHTATHFNIR